MQRFAPWAGSSATGARAAARAGGEDCGRTNAWRTSACVSLTSDLPKKASSCGSDVTNFSFCFGVRSPCRVNATTQSSSPSGDGPPLPICHEPFSLNSSASSSQPEEGERPMRSAVEEPAPAPAKSALASSVVWPTQRCSASAAARSREERSAREMGTCRAANGCRA